MRNGTDNALVVLEALGPSGRYRARARAEVTEVNGRPAAELSLVPALYVHRALGAMRRSSALPADERLAALARGGAAFAEESVDGLSPDDYQRLVSRVSGLPISVVRQAVTAIAARAAGVYPELLEGRPSGAVADWRDPLARTGVAVWVRRGETFGLHAAGNHPGVNTSALEALALGYRVAVRPSRREPFTAHRLVSALRAAGFGDAAVSFVPTDHEAADELVRAADLSIVFGGDDVMARFALRPKILALGPGRTKILLTAETDWRRQIGLIVDSVAGGGGTGCMNATAVLVEGDPAPVAEAIAERLAELPSLPPEDEKAVLPVQSLAAARRIEAFLLEVAAGATPVLGGEGVCDDLGDGSAALRPAVHLLERADAPQARVELSFPCVWVTPWSRADGVAPLRHSLVVTAMTEDAELADELLAEPTIRNLNLGPVPTFESAPGLPHDGYLSGFLMESKSVHRASAPAGRR